MTLEQKDVLITEVNKLHERNELSKTVEADYFEPGMMEYLSESDGIYDTELGQFILRFEVKGTRYDGRTELIENVKIGDEITVFRDSGNKFNNNNFCILDRKNRNLGNVPAELSNAIAPIYDIGELVFKDSFVSYVEPLSKRSRHAKQAVLYVQLEMILNVL